MGDLSGFYDDNDKPMSFEPLPVGDYLSVLSASEWKTTQAGTGRYVSMTWEVIDGQYKNRKIFNNLNLDNPNPDAVKFARADLAAIRNATGVINPNNTSDLHNIPILLTLGIKKNRETGDMQNVIKAYKPAGQKQQPQQKDNTPAYMRRT